MSMGRKERREEGRREGGRAVERERERERGGEGEREKDLSWFFFRVLYGANPCKKRECWGLKKRGTNNKKRGGSDVRVVLRVCVYN
jgi:hypothetical protein